MSERSQCSPVLFPTRRTLHSKTHAPPSSEPGFLPIAGPSASSALPPHLPLALLHSSVRLAGYHTPAPADQTIAPALPRTGELLPPLPGADNTRHAPAGLPPALH